MKTETESAPILGSSFGVRIGVLVRKGQRQKAALARLEKGLARTKHRLREKTQDAEFSALTITEGLRAWGQGRETEALLILEEGRTILQTRHGLEAALQAARKRDQALLTLRAKVTELHGALTRAKRTIRGWHSHGLTQTEEAHGWALYQGSPEMQQINKALGE